MLIHTEQQNQTLYRWFINLRLQQECGITSDYLHGLFPLTL